MLSLAINGVVEEASLIVSNYVLCVSRVSAKDASFELRLHLIYLINDILHHWSVLTLTLSLATRVVT